MNKITLNHLAERIAESTGQPIEQIRTFVTAFFVEASGQLEAGKSVKVKGIGTFNPDGTFTPDEALADEVNSPFSFFEPVELAPDVTEEMLASVEPEREPEEAAPEPKEEVASEPPVEEAPEHKPEPAEAPAPPEENKVDIIANEAKIAIPEEEAPAEEAVPEHPAKPSPWGYIGFLALGMVIGMALMYFLMPMLTPTVHEPEAETEVTEISIVEEEEAPAPQPEVAVVTDTVKPGVYFSTMARRHYGDKSFWVYIYEENITLLDSCHPEHVMPGTVVVIPPAEKYGIDASDIASVDSAKRKVSEIYGRFN